MYARGVDPWRSARSLVGLRLGLVHGFGRAKRHQSAGRGWIGERKGDGKRTRLEGYGSCLGFEKGRLREDRRREGMLGAGRDLCVSRKEDEEDDIVEHEREVVGHEILVMINVVCCCFDPALALTQC